MTFRLALAGAALASLCIAASAGAVVPGGNGQVLFPRTNDLWAVSPNFGAQTQLTSIKGREFGQWSSDGRRIAFSGLGPRVAGRKDKNIYIANADGSGVRQFEAPGVAESPRWSPDDRHIVYLNKPLTGRRQLFIMRSNGADATQLTDDPTLSVHGLSEFSPDGTRIAYAGFGAGRVDLYTIAPDGSDRRQVTADPVASYVLRDWSPDGAWLLAHRRVVTLTGPGPLDTDLQVDLVRIAPDGSREQLIFSHGPTEWLAGGTWAPDGTTIIFTLGRDDNLGAPSDGQRVMSVRPDGTGLRALTPWRDTAAEAFAVDDWQSLPCTISGTDGADRLIGTPGDDVICGFAGRDTINGRGGNDRIIGGPGNDRLLGGSGDDELEGGGGRDTMLGGAGRDLLLARMGDRDELNGGSGRDRARVDRGLDRTTRVEVVRRG